MIVLYNLAMLVVSVTALSLTARTRTPGAGALALVTTAAASVLLAAGLGIGTWNALQLFACGLFLHCGVVLAALTWLLWKTAPKTAIVSGIACLTLGAIGIDAFFIEPHWLEVTRLELVAPKLSRSLRLAIIADLQTDNVGDYERRVLRQSLNERPDIILMAGDYLQVDRHETARLATLHQELNTLLKEVDFQAPLGVFAVRGNVDAGNWTESFEGLPITLFRSTGTVQLADLRITGLSVHDSGVLPADRTAPIVDVPNDGKYHIMLGHLPNFALRKVDADLLVAGHTHGGQVQLPFLGPIVTHALVPRSWASGVTDLGDGRTLIVSRGVGMERGVAPRLRFLCRPQLIVVDLVPSGK